jgi:hypothetical protein
MKVCIPGTSNIPKGKVHPRTGHEGSEGEWRYSSTLSLNSALDGGGWSGNDLVPVVQEAG